MSKNRKLRCFAGPNGSGKSTLFNSISKVHNTGSFINADRIENLFRAGGRIDLLAFGISVLQESLDSFLKQENSRSIVEKARNEGVNIDLEIKDNYLIADRVSLSSYTALLVALFIRSQIVLRGLDFSFETVMSHPSKLEELRKANERGFHVYLYFVCTDNPDLNISRIDKRVSNGGHDVPDERVRRRYEGTLQNLSKTIELTHRTYLFDNSGKAPVMIAEIHNGLLSITSDSLPNWFHKFVLPYYS